jgi:hypothetical protein
MPWSSDEGKGWMLDRIRWHAAQPQAAPLSILDVGPGAGTYAKLIYGDLVPHGALGHAAEWAGPVLPRPVLDAVEIHEPYVQRFRLDQLYHRVFVEDARSFLALMATKQANEWDLIILGDVLEHMPVDDAVELWDNARKVARRAVLLSIPMGEYPQGECEGNPHEAHVATWTHMDVCERLSGVTAGAFSVTSSMGCYEAPAAGR